MHQPIVQHAAVLARPLTTWIERAQCLGGAVAMHVSLEGLITFASSSSISLLGLDHRSGFKARPVVFRCAAHGMCGRCSPQWQVHRSPWERIPARNISCTYRLAFRVLIGTIKCTSLHTLPPSFIYTDRWQSHAPCHLAAGSWWVATSPACFRLLRLPG